MEDKQLINTIHVLEKTIKHLRRITMVYMKCPEKCLCNGVCEHPDLERTTMIEAEAIEVLHNLSRELKER